MRQIAVVVRDEPGQLAEVAELLAARGINIEAFGAEEVAARGVIVLTVDREDEALLALRDAGFAAVSRETLLIRLEDRPGALAEVAARLRDAGLDLRSMHILRRDAAGAIVSLVADDNERAAAVLGDIVVS